MSAFHYLRFRLAAGEGHIYLVGADAGKMREDAPRIAPLAEDEKDGERVSSEIVFEEALRHGPNSSGWDGMDMLDAGVKAAREGCPSFYLFG